jgi:hypothetical protein
MGDPVVQVVPADMADLEAQADTTTPDAPITQARATDSTTVFTPACTTPTSVDSTWAGDPIP